MVYDLIQAGGMVWDKNGVQCTVDDYVICEQEGDYMMVRIEALTTTTEKFIDKITGGFPLGKVVANSTETILFFEEQKSEDRGI